MIPALANSWNEFLALEPVLTAMGMLEKRMENDSSGRILYVAYTMIPGASTSANVWMVRKFGYDDNNFLNYDQLPQSGPGLIYNWDDRATYFS